MGKHFTITIVVASVMATTQGRVRLLASVLLFVAAGIHVLAAYEPDHLESQLFYVFWAIVAAQSVAGALVLLRNDWGVAGAILVNVVLILAYVVTRLVPVFEEAPEPVDALGVASKAVELASLPLLVRLWRAVPSRETPKVPAELA